METLDYFNQLLYDSFTENKEIFGGIVFYGQILGAICTLFAASKIVHSYYYGEKFKVENIYYIIAISITISLYQPITQILIYVTDAFAIGLSLEAKKKLVHQPHDLISILDWNNVDNNIDNESEKLMLSFTQNKEFDSQILSLVNKHAPRSANKFEKLVLYYSDNFVNSEYKVVHNTLLIYLSYLSRGLIMGIYVLRHTILFVLFLLGPIIIALSLLPGFRKVLMAWLIKYISVTLWLPIAYLIEMVLVLIFDKLTNNSSELEMGLSSVSTKIFFSLFTVFCYLLIPFISYWLIEKNVVSKWT